MKNILYPLFIGLTILSCNSNDSGIEEALKEEAKFLKNQEDVKIEIKEKKTLISKSEIKVSSLYEKVTNEDSLLTMFISSAQLLELSIEDKINMIAELKSNADVYKLKKGHPNDMILIKDVDAKPTLTLLNKLTQQIQNIPKPMDVLVDITLIDSGEGYFNDEYYFIYHKMLTKEKLKDFDPELRYSNSYFVSYQNKSLCIMIHSHDNEVEINDVISI